MIRPFTFYIILAAGHSVDTPDAFLLK